MRRAIAMFGLVLVGSGCAKIVVEDVRPNMGGAGMFYALPKTIVHVSLKADMKTLTAAPYQDYAPIFAPGGSVACDAIAKCGAPEETDPEAMRTKTSYSIQPGATFATSGIPDPDNVYLVKFTRSAAVDQALSMTWTETGVLSAASATVTNRATDIAMSGLKLAAGIVTKTAYAGPSAKSLTDRCAQQRVDRAKLDSIAKSKHQLNPPTSADTSACVPRCPIEYGPRPNDTWVLPILGEVNSSLVANYCAAPQKYRDTLSRNEPALARATAAYYNKVVPLLAARQGAYNDRMGFDPIALITKLEGMLQDQLNALYLGTTTTKTWEGLLDLEPDASTQTTFMHVLRVNVDKGFCIDDKLISPDAKPFPKGFKNHVQAVCEDTTTKSNHVGVRMALYPANGQLFTKARDAALDRSGDRGFRYRIPAQVRGDLVREVASKPEDTFGSAVFSVAQKGYVAWLPARHNAKMMSYDLAMVEATGALKTFKLGTTGSLDAATVDALSTSAGSILDARNAAAKQAKTDADELTTLTRQDSLLKLKDEICTLQKKYGVDCTVQP